MAVLLNNNALVEDNNWMIIFLQKVFEKNKVLEKCVID